MNRALTLIVLLLCSSCVTFLKVPHPSVEQIPVGKAVLYLYISDRSGMMFSTASVEADGRELVNAELGKVYRLEVPAGPSVLVKVIHDFPTDIRSEGIDFTFEAGSVVYLRIEGIGRSPAISFVDYFEASEQIASKRLVVH